MPGHIAVVGFLMAFFDERDRHHEPGTALITASTRASIWPTGAQHVARITLDDPLRAVEHLVDGSRRQHRRTVACGEFVDGLLGAPALVEIALHELTESRRHAPAVDASALVGERASSPAPGRSILAVDGGVGLQFTDVARVRFP